jgi:hypothetical protein
MSPLGREAAHVPTYVAGDIRSIQDYIFSAPRLYLMRGASAIVSFFDREVVRRLVADHGGEVVSSGGGNFLARFDGSDGSGDASGRFIAAVENAFLDLTGGHEIVVEEMTTDAPFDQVVAELQRRLRRRKHAPAGVQALASMPFLKRCESCGRETADQPWKLPSAEADDSRREWLGPACDRKRRMHNVLAEAQQGGTPARQGVFGVAGLLDVPPLHPDLAAAGLPDDFESLAGDDDLATLVADGNDLGSWFAGLDRERYEGLSRQIVEKMEVAISEGLRAAFAAGEKLSVQVLVCGGDDLVVALPARRALDFTRALVAAFRIDDPKKGRTTGFAAGLLLSKPTFPFRRAHALAEELLHRAKARCKEERIPSAVDLLRVTATHVQSLDRELAAREGEGPEDSAWSYGAAGPYSGEELAALVTLADELRRQVPASQRGRLREILSPREQGPETVIDERWGVPARVIRELETWRLRQDGELFDAALEANRDRFVREERRPAGQGARTYQLWMLHDALMLAEVGGS